MDIRARCPITRSKLAAGARLRGVSKGKRVLAEDEKQLWRRVAASVKARQPTASSEPVNRTDAALSAKLAAGVSPAPSRLAPSVSAPQDRGGEKRVRRGRIEIGATLDLHGYNQVTGRTALAQFLHRERQRGARAVIVVTGVGRGGTGVLRRRLPEWLAEPELRVMVSGFAQAHRTHGGAGAYYVFLRAGRRAE